MSPEDVKKENMNVNSKKSSSSKAIPEATLKQSVHIYLTFLTKCISHSFVANKFLDELKQSEVIPLYKKLDSLKKEKYRHASLLPHASKVFLQKHTLSNFKPRNQLTIYVNLPYVSKNHITTNNVLCHKFTFRLY